MPFFKALIWGEPLNLERRNLAPGN